MAEGKDRPRLSRILPPRGSLETGRPPLKSEECWAQVLVRGRQMQAGHRAQIHGAPPASVDGLRELACREVLVNGGRGSAAGSHGRHDKIRSGDGVPAGVHAGAGRGAGLRVGHDQAPLPGF